VFGTANRHFSGDAQNYDSKAFSLFYMRETSTRTFAIFLKKEEREIDLNFDPSNEQ